MMDAFAYRDGQLFAEDVPLAAIADAVGTPCYVYSRGALETQWRALDAAFGDRPHLVCYAVKANSNLAVLNLLAHLGSGFDIVSVGELERVLRAGGDPAKVVFSGVGKTTEEMARALAVGIRCFNVESEPELERLSEVATRLGLRAPVSLRVNPDVDARTHPYIATGLKENKFGVPIARARSLYARARRLPNLEIVGLDCHIGSQLTDVAPFADAAGRALELVDSLAADGIALRHLDLGGGLGIRYRDEQPPAQDEYVRVLLSRLQPRHRHLEILIEPGRAIVGNSGVLLTRVEYLKIEEAKNFAIVDAGMNDLVRPALYDAWQEIVPARIDAAPAPSPRHYDVVGPVCESGDFLGKDRELAIAPGDLLVVRSAGAYGFSMSSNYNTRPRPAEVMVEGDRFYTIRRRESFDEMLAGESLPPG